MHPCTDKTIPTLNPNPITCIPNDKKSRGVYTDFITKLLFLRGIAKLEEFERYKWLYLKK